MNFPGGVTLYYNITPCAFSLKIIGPLEHTAHWKTQPPIAGTLVWYHPLLHTQWKYPTPYCIHNERVILLIARSLQASFRVVLHKGAFCKHSVTWTIPRQGLIAGLSSEKGAYLLPRGPALEVEKHPLSRKIWNAHGVIPAYRVTPPGIGARTRSAPYCDLPCYIVQNNVDILY